MLPNFHFLPKYKIHLIPLLLFSYYQLNHYTNVSDLWFYDAFSKDSDLDDYKFLYFRNDRVRAPSFFDGPINASLFFSYMFCLFWGQRKKIVNKIVVLTIPLIGVYLSNTRIGFAVICLYIVAYFFKKQSYKKLCLLPMSMIFITIASLIFGYYEEASALGRIVQYANFFNDFNLIGLGLSSSEILVKYDSFFISLFLGLGFVSLFFYNFFYTFLRRTYFCIQKRLYISDITICLYLLTIISIYIIAFQFYAGYASYKIYVLFLFYAYNNVNSVIYGKR